MSAEPEHRAEIEREVLRVGWLSALGLGVLLLAGVPGAGAAAAARQPRPGPAGRRDLGPADPDGRPVRRAPGRAPLGAPVADLPRARDPTAGDRGGLHRLGADADLRDARDRHRGACARPSSGGSRSATARADGRDTGRSGRRAPAPHARHPPRDGPQLAGPAGLLRAVERRHRRGPPRPRQPPGRHLRRGPDPDQGDAVPAAVRRRGRVPRHVHRGGAATRAAEEPRAGRGPRGRRHRRRLPAARARPRLRRRIGVRPGRGPAVAVRRPRHRPVDAAAAGVRRAGTQRSPAGPAGLGGVRRADRRRACRPPP